jgi:hypothetical protein
MSDTRRTDAQRLANEMDCDIYRFILWAERESVKDKQWLRVVQALKAARPPIRGRMHADDRAQTS